MAFDKVTMNLVANLKRHEILEGKQYLVLPAVMLTEGVHVGSEGPLLYQGQEMGKRPVTWNHKPVVVMHPMLQGQGISACDPTVVETQRVGLMFNSDYDGRLKTEAWVDEQKLRRLSPEVMEAIDNNQMVEISTGLFHDLEATPGEFNGKPYVGIVRNIQPDHLAILVGQKGACSIADGGGLLRNSEPSPLSFDEVKEQIRSLLRARSPDSYYYVADVYPKFVIYESADKAYKLGYKTKDGKVSLDGEPEPVRRVVSYVTTNGSFVRNNAVRDLATKDQFENIRPLAQRAILDKFLPDTDVTFDDITDGYLIWTKGDRQFRLRYTIENANIRLEGDPEEVDAVTDYKPKAKIITGNQSPYPSQGNDNMTAPINNTSVQAAFNLPAPTNPQSDPRKGVVDKLISAGGWLESDRQFLTDLPQDGFQKLVSKFGQAFPTTPPPAVIQPPATTPPPQIAVPLPVPPAAVPMTANQYVENAPPEIRELLRTGLATIEQEKRRLVETITQNQQNVFNPAWLNLQTSDVLRGIAAVATPAVQHAPSPAPVNNYGGQGDVPMFLDPSKIVQNQNQQPSEDQVLKILPVFGGKDEKAAS